MNIGLLLIFPEKRMKRIIRRFEFLGKFLLQVFPFVKSDLRDIEYDGKATVFLTNVFLSAVFWALVVGWLFYTILTNQIRANPHALGISIAIALYTFVMHIIFNVIHPRAKRIDMTKRMDRDLSFVLKDIIIQLRSGVTLYDAFVTATEGSSYGVASRKLREVVSKISQGYTYKEALQELAASIKSDFMKNVLWQLANTFHVGGNVEPVFKSMEQTLKEYHEMSIHSYLESANIMLFGYLLFGAVLPAIFLITGVVIGMVMGINISDAFVVGTLGLSLLVEAFLVGHLRASKPAVMS